MPEIVLNGLGWDHERCMGPMRAAAEAWRRLRPGVRIEWAARPLESFNDEPVEEIADRFDLLVVDHPFSGTAAATGCLTPLDELVPEAELSRLAADSIGLSHASYAYAGKQWALAADAACHVGAVRDDLLARADAQAPSTWDEVTALAAALPGRVALPLYPTDAICSLLTIAASRRAPAPSGISFFPSPEDGAASIGLLAGLVPLLHRDSFAFNPPRALDRMRDTDEIAAIPLLFGYTNYSRPGTQRAVPRSGTAQPCQARPPEAAVSQSGIGPGMPGPARIRFVDIPSAGHGPVGALLGGAGLAVSAASAHPREAAAFAAWVCGADAQREVVFPAGGQPASRSAWLDPALDAASGGFFSGTLRSIEAAYVRPRDAGWPRFQEAAGRLVADALLCGSEPATVAAELEDLYARHLGTSPAPLASRPDPLYNPAA